MTFQGLLKLIRSNRNDYGDPISALEILKRSSLKVAPVRRDLKLRKKSLESDFRAVKEMTADFPDFKDWSGALRGMFLLYDTYEFSIDEAVKGNLVYRVGLTKSGDSEMWGRSSRVVKGAAIKRLNKQKAKRSRVRHPALATFKKGSSNSNLTCKAKVTLLI